MSYYNLAQLAADQKIMLRVTACAASEGIPDPQFWAQTHAWQFAASPGWAEAYAYALETSVEHPGRDETVITDGMILAAVQTIANPQ